MLRLTLCLTLILSVAACGTRLNPFNWFGGDREERIAVVDTTEPADPRPLMTEILSLSVESTAQGAIVRVTGLPPSQGYWGADLVETDRTGNAIVYEFRAVPPLDAAAQGTPASREVVVGTQLSNFDLAGIRTITVIGAQNRRTVSRR